MPGLDGYTDPDLAARDEHAFRDTDGLVADLRAIFDRDAKRVARVLDHTVYADVRAAGYGEHVAGVRRPGDGGANAPAAPQHRAKPDGRDDAARRAAARAVSALDVIERTDDILVIKDRHRGTGRGRHHPDNSYVSDCD